jgi:membrane associated rhomboid family serine protease
MIEQNNNENNNNNQLPNIINDENNLDSNINENNNNPNNNINNINNNQVNFNEQNNRNQNLLKYTRTTFSFLIILFINITIKIYSYFYNINCRKYVFQFSPIFERNQYYRFISSHFIHYGIWHLIIESYFTYEICNIFENMMGTLFTISFIIVSMILNSVIHFLMIPLLIFIFKVLKRSHDLNYDYESSLTSVLFTMVTFYFLFKHNKNKKFDILYTFVLNVKYLSLSMLFFLYIFTPNKSFYSNLSGILAAHLIKFSYCIFLPRVSWIVDFENCFGEKKNCHIYRYITYKNHLMRHALNELQKDSVIDERLLKNNINENINYRNDFNDIGNQMSELTNIQNLNMHNNN